MRHLGISHVELIYIVERAESQLVNDLPSQLQDGFAQLANHRWFGEDTIDVFDGTGCRCVR